MAVSFDDGTIKIYDSNLAFVTSYKIHTLKVNGLVEESPGSLFSCSDDKSIQLYDLKTESVRKNIVHLNPVSQLAHL